jgi:putative ABC transport system permease protein
MLTEWFSRLRFFITGKSRSEVDEELQYHVDREIEANIAAGMAAAEARRQAAISFGSRERARDECREQRPAWFLESVMRDIRYGLRGLWHNPASQLSRC